MADISFIKLLVLHAKAIIDFLGVKLSCVVVVCGSLALSTNCPGTIVIGGNCPEDNCPADNYLEAIFLGKYVFRNSQEHSAHFHNLIFNLT